MDNFQDTFRRIHAVEVANEAFEPDFDENQPISRQFAWQQVISEQTRRRLEPTQISLQLTSF